MCELRYGWRLSSAIDVAASGYRAQCRRCAESYGVDCVAKAPRGQRQRSVLIGSLLLSVMRESFMGSTVRSVGSRPLPNLKFLRVMLYAGFFHVSSIEPSQSFSGTYA